MSLGDALIGFAKAAVRRGRIERILDELEWSIDERKGKTIGLNFRCPVVGVRPVYISKGDEALVFFAVYSGVTFDSRKVPDFATNFALVQNDELIFGRWGAAIEDDEMGFRMVYTALGDALTAEGVKAICERMIEDAAIFDQRMKQEGWL